MEDARRYQPRNWRSEPVASSDWLGYPVCRGRGIYRGAPLPPATGPGDGRRRPGPRVTLSFPPPTAVINGKRSPRGSQASVLSNVERPRPVRSFSGPCWIVEVRSDLARGQPRSGLHAGRGPPGGRRRRVSTRGRCSPRWRPARTACRGGRRAPRGARGPRSAREPACGSRSARPAVCARGGRNQKPETSPEGARRTCAGAAWPRYPRSGSALGPTVGLIFPPGTRRPRCRGSRD